MKPAKRSNYILILLIIILLLFHIKCSKENINEDTAVKIYTENVIIEEKYAYNPDSLRLSQKKLFERYKTSKKKFENYLNKLRTDIEKWQNFFKKADKYLEDLKNAGAIN